MSQLSQVLLRLIIVAVLASVALPSAQEECAAEGEPQLGDEHAVLALIYAREYFQDGLLQALQRWGFAPVSREGWDDDGPGLCEELETLAIGRVAFFGDAHMRQLFVAAASVLTGNYQDAALRLDSVHPSSCEDLGQFSHRKECVQALRDSVTACGVHLQYQLRKGFNDSRRVDSWPSTPEGRPHELWLDNMEPGTTLTAWWWILWLRGASISELLHPSESCEAWIKSRAYGSPIELVHVQHAARRLAEASQTQVVDEDVMKPARERAAAAGAAPHSRPLCDLSGQYTEGEWRRVSPRTSRARNLTPVCCLTRVPGSKHDELLNFSHPEFCGPGRVVGESYRGHDKYLIPSSGYRYCGCDWFEDVHEWLPDHCRLLPWSAEDFCRVLGNRTVLFLGDSTVGQAATTLINRIHFGSWNEGSTGCQTQITYQLSDTLVGRHFGINDRGMEWKEAVRKYVPDVLVLGAAAHIPYTEHFDTVIRTAPSISATFQISPCFGRPLSQAGVTSTCIASRRPNKRTTGKPTKA